jgi:hypothetical protein
MSKQTAQAKTLRLCSNIYYAVRTGVAGTYVQSKWIKYGWLRTCLKLN